MSNSIFSADDAYKFLKVEEYFARYKEWEKLEKVTSHSLYLDESEDKALTFDFEKSDGQKCTMLIQFLQQDIFRVRFRPDRNPTEGNPYTDINTRSAVTNTFKELRKFLEAAKGSFSIQENKVSEQKFEFITNPALDSPIANSKPSLKLVVNYNPFTLEVFHRFNDGREFRVWKTATPGIYYRENGDEYAIIQAVNKPGSAKYIGFGEQGGMELYKNTDQLNYFNYDNMRYRQIYNTGPLDHREPLYHSDPFFMEFNGVCDVGDEDSVYGIFIDNTSQVLMDIGHDNSSRYLFGIRFGELDYYFMLGQEAKDILECFTCIVGKERLKPRYALGYHQGCYGYENRGALEWVVGKYRQHQIPLDGLHVDVDIQNNYQTFTIDENKFPNPQEMFGNLKAKGVKCSTNITPIISNRDINYTTYKEGRDNNYFVLDRRLDNDRTNQNYNGGYEQLGQYNDAEGNFNSDPQDKAIYNDKLKFLNNQFFVRDDLLVAPILAPESENEGKRDVYLPAGSNWYGFMDSKFPLRNKVEGGTTIRNFEAILDDSYSKISFIVPIYVREGAIIPTIELEQYVKERNKTGQLNPITLNIYPGSQGQYTMYLDDGESRASAKIDPLQDNNDPEAKEEYREVKIAHQTLNATTREIKIERVHDNYTPLEPYFFVAPLHDPQEPKGSNGPLMRVTIAGQAITLKSDSDALNSAHTNAWYYNPNINISLIKVFDNSPSITITLEYLT